MLFLTPFVETHYNPRGWLVSQNEHDTFLIGEGPLGRRHLRVVSPFLRGTGRNGCERPGRRRCARRARNCSVHGRARGDPHRGRDRSCRGVVSQRPVRRLQNGRRRVASFAGAVSDPRSRACLHGRDRLADVEFEADDALASAAAKAAREPAVDQVVICTPDKDLGQCIMGTRVVQLDRRRGVVRDEAGVVEKFGVVPASIPDYLALVGDSADGYPGLSGWGPKAAALTLSQYPHLETIPKDWQDWHPSIRKARTLAGTLFDGWNDVLLYRTLATLRLDVPVFNSVGALRWTGPSTDFEDCCRRLQSPELFARAISLSGRDR